MCIPACICFRVCGSTVCVDRVGTDVSRVRVLRVYVFGVGPSLLIDYTWLCKLLCGSSHKTDFDTLLVIISVVGSLG